MPLGRDNYLSTVEFLKGLSESTQAVCLSGDFLLSSPSSSLLSRSPLFFFSFQHLVEMICLLSAVDLLLSSSAAHYCSRKAARSGERQAGSRGGREGGWVEEGGGRGGSVVLSRPADSGAAVMADTVTRQSGRDHHHHCCSRCDGSYCGSLLHGCSQETDRTRCRGPDRSRSQTVP